jgi:hypothetical protein
MSGNFDLPVQLDLFEDGISLQGFVLKYLMKGTENEFLFFDKEDK